MHLESMDLGMSVRGVLMTTNVDLSIRGIKMKVGNRYQLKGTTDIIEVTANTVIWHFKNGSRHLIKAFSVTLHPSGEAAVIGMQDLSDSVSNGDLIKL